MAEDTLFSGESKNVEYKVTVPEKSEKYMKTVFCRQQEVFIQKKKVEKLPLIKTCGCLQQAALPN